jgi:uncharacterized SAM-binding protein YcdF (DUF218 family)
MATMFQGIAKCGRWIAYGALLAIVGGCLALASAGHWLIPAQETLRPADAIVVLAGGFERSLYAADLYNRGLAPKVWVSRPARERGAQQLEQLGIVLPSEQDIQHQILLRKGVPPGDIEFFGTGSLSTVEEALALRDRTAGTQRRLIIVTSSAHVRRANIVIKDALKEQGVNLQVVATPYEHFDPMWWRDQGSARAVVLELAKLVHYFLGGRYLSTARPG